MLVSSIGFFFRLAREERARLFVTLRDRLSYLPGRLKEVARFSFSEQLLWARRVVKKAARRAIPRMRFVCRNTGVDSSRLQSSDSPASPYRIPLGTYIPGRYSGRVEFFWADAEPARYPSRPGLRWNQLADPTLGWGRVAKALRMHILPGVTNTSITRDVKILADQMKACLQEPPTSL